MTLVRLIQIMQTLARDHKKRVFTLREISALTQSARAASAMMLLRAAQKGLVARVGNLWLNMMDPPELLEVAQSLPSPSYLSFESALFRHGILSQAPRGALTMASTGRPRIVQTPLGIIRFIHLKPSLFFGFDADRIAFPEKAWLDLIYIRRGCKNLITEEFDLSGLKSKSVKRFIEKFPDWVGV